MIVGLGALPLRILRKVITVLLLLTFGCLSCPARAQSSSEGGVKFPIEGDSNPLPLENQFPFLMPGGPAPNLDRSSTSTSAEKDSSSADNANSKLNLPIYPLGMADNDPNDPDTSPALRESWKVWYRDVAEAIQLRFDEIAKRTISQTHAPLNCEATFTISNKRKIVSIHLVKKSNNVRFNSILPMVAKTLNGNSILEFPTGSKREYVRTTGKFHSSSAIICDPPALKRSIQDFPSKN